MDDVDRKWHLAWAQLDAFSKNLPSSIEEKHVAEFHAILALLNEATGEDISPFLIPDEEVKPQIASVRPAGRRSPALVNYTKQKYCAHDLMLRKIDAVYGYFRSIQAPVQKPSYGF